MCMGVRTSQFWKFMPWSTILATAISNRLWDTAITCIATIQSKTQMKCTPLLLKFY